MTCFRLADGRTVRSVCKNNTEYMRFFRAMETGATDAEALNVIHIRQHKGRPTPDFLKRVREVVEKPNDSVELCIRNRMRRHNETVDQALLWAARLCKVTIKKKYQKSVYERGLKK